MREKAPNTPQTCPLVSESAIGTLPNMIDHSSLLDDLIRIAVDAGIEIMKVYESDIAVEHKDDKSPVTEADRRGEAIILAGLAKVAGDIPVVAEEAAAAGHIPEVGERFFLVDPLDGTKEFIKKNGEFTVNIALIENTQATVGVIYVPAKQKIYAGFGDTAFIQENVDPHEPDPLAGASTRQTIQVRTGDRRALVAVASRSHRDTKTDEYLSQYNIADMVAAGSSLKFCLVAEGVADLYPRHGPTMEWDTAAGHAIVNAAGGEVTRLDGSPFLYGKTADKFKNPFFVVRGRVA